jgi:hypothetical protein
MCWRRLIATSIVIVPISIGSASISVFVSIANAAVAGTGNTCKGRNTSRIPSAIINAG